jgi:hypothetical protein
VIEVREVANRTALAEFVDFPYRKYRNHPYWVPPLRMSERDRFNQRKSPFLEHADMGLFLAVDNGATVGRIAAIDDHTHNATHHDNLAAFGFFEADSEAAARALFAAAEQWARKKTRTLMRGPLNPSLNDSAGLLIDGFDDAPFLLMPYNPPEYATYIENAGYRKVKDLYAWIYELALFNPKVAELAERVKKRHQIVVRTIDTRRMEEEIKFFLEIYAVAWKDNWGFVTPTPAEAAHFASELKQILDIIIHSLYSHKDIFLRELIAQGRATLVSAVAGVYDREILRRSLCRSAWSRRCRLRRCGRVGHWNRERLRGN